ncbi:PEP-CTERM protein-sorting domain-containing protein [Malonomonas rubra DSM 5091]|uniref:PEP-CTERM protein-sorting domain-containing protein n=1 Tax=Malonomonas rubra DSM 5091 TaxID=1122189 RepID=A0A1M6L7G4_MALRU|nr:PEP-CTERM sorting domain-containing protein [Malonomonas rubra]SHJ67153.1 PEP-CTERM protein-sorting domain-containing protein [Malonomonas rubra DSM 5091]
MRSFLLVLIFVLSFATVSFAGSLGVFDSSWTLMTAEDTVGSDGFVDPGWGGQDFDAEYLYYKYSYEADGTYLWLGLQTGFDLDDGRVYSSGKNYFSGDLAISFDGDSGQYEYAFDFGLKTMDASLKLVEADDNGDGFDVAGLYGNVAWNSNIDFTASSPFAMDAGDLLLSVASAEATNQLFSDSDSYARIVSFNLADIAGLNFTGLDVHWTMSCGNDVIEGDAPVPTPEPSTFILFAAGGGLALWARRKKK